MPKPLPPITFDRRCYYIDGKPAFFYSGEFHYFRVPRDDWRRRMRLFRAAGGNCLATYVPWLLHEPAEGTFVFDDGQLDLEGFLRMAAEERLYVIARPGPYQYSELAYAGLPRWLCEGYPALMAQNPDGSRLHPISISYNHPLFLQKAHAWFDVVCPRIARHTLSRGGAVAFTQIDNELGGIHTWFGGLDYNAEAMGIGDPDGRYPRFLRAKYGEIAALNAAYGADFPDFAAVRPALAGDAPADLRRRKDYFDFYIGALAEYAVTLTGWLRGHGIDTPIVHNAANPGMNPWFVETAAALGPEFLLGSDHYYSLGQDWAQNNPTPQYAARVFTSLETLRLMGYPPTVYELPGGSPSDWPPFTPSDAKACYLANVALGMKGSNFYIFTGGPNIPGSGETGEIYDYSAAIAADGTVRPLYAVQKAVGQFLKRRPWLAAAERVADVRIAHDILRSRAGEYWGTVRDIPCAPPEADAFQTKGLLSTAFCAGCSPALVDLGADDWLADTATPLLVASSSVMAAAEQARLVRYLRAGGRALIAPVLPAFDDDLRPCTLLADALGAPPAEKVPSGRSVQLNIAGVRSVLCNGNAFLGDPPAGAEVLGHDAVSGRAVAWQTGGAIVLGLRWSHAMREHERMLAALLARLGAVPRVRADNPNVWVTLWTGGGHHALFLLNLLTSVQETRVTADGREFGPYRLPGITVKVVEW